ncbi:unnamed protein product [Caenorhabditis angaria]|uniref:Profilin n=1 Tax=Caenorhabditis angaria TaxID=860376 RepID=A0A9P1J0X5_9PELO|nr:unnamed protein product [Caenorhabditis angaria]
MSGWDAYIQSMTARSDAIKRAAIIGTDGSVWARTQDPNPFGASEAELKKFAALFNDINSVPSTGADLENVHYIVPRVEEKLIFGKKEKTGFFAAKTKSAILIAVYEDREDVDGSSSNHNHLFIQFASVCVLCVIAAIASSFYSSSHYHYFPSLSYSSFNTPKKRVVS